MNQHAETGAVCPLTTKLHPTWRSRIPMRSAGKTAEIAVDHIRRISTLRLVTKVDALALADAARLRGRIVEMYGLPFIAGKVAWISSLNAASHHAGETAVQLILIEPLFNVRPAQRCDDLQHGRA